jgi:Domain of unknown function (DUF6371)/CHC2 zinc finger
MSKFIKISQSDIDNVFEKSNIESYVGESVALKKHGSALVALCPFHNEKTPSFYVLPQKGRFKCHGCEKNGDIVAFAMEKHGFNFPQAIQDIANFFKIPINGEVSDAPKREKQIQSMIHDEGVFLPMDIVQKSWNNYKENDYVTYLLAFFKDVDTVGRLVNTFKIGTLHAIHSLIATDKQFCLKSLTNAVIFYYINENHCITYGKTMVYDSKTGRRGKGKYDAGSLHRLLNLQKPKHAFFGLHQLNDNHSKTVRIVESENTAIVMTGLYPNYVWLATGSASNLRLESMLDIGLNRKIQLYPDKGQYDDKIETDKNGKEQTVFGWNHKCKEFADNGFTDVSISDFLEKLDAPKNYDILDYVRDKRAEMTAKQV